VASVRANQIGQLMSALGDLKPAARLGRSAKALPAEFYRLFHSSNLLIAEFL
jgi:hypothetical protein